MGEVIPAARTRRSYSFLGTFLGTWLLLWLSTGCADEVEPIYVERRPPGVGAKAQLGEFCNLQRGRPCAPGLLCVDDPADPCESKKPDTPCAGVCVDGGAFCGGAQDFPCRSSDICVDDPTDHCDRQRLGRLCDGVCAPRTCTPEARPHCRHGTWVGPVQVPDS